MKKTFCLALSAVALSSGFAFAQSPAGAVATPNGVVVVKEVDRTRYHKHIVERAIPNFVWDGQVRTGVTVPMDRVKVYSFPEDYNAPGYRYAKVNDKLVLIDPKTGSIVDILN